MRCSGCDYQNPSGQPLCLECGLALGEDTGARAKRHFVRSLQTAQEEAEDRRRRRDERSGTSLGDRGAR